MAMLYRQFVSHPRINPWQEGRSPAGSKPGSYEMRVGTASAVQTLYFLGNDLHLIQQLRTSETFCTYCQKWTKFLARRRPATAQSV